MQLAWAFLSPPSWRLHAAACRAVVRSTILRLAIRRLLITVPVVFGTSVLTFCTLDLLPGSAAQALLGADATRAQVEQLETELRLDRPAVTRYWEWVSRLARADFGRSIASDQPALELIAKRLPVTLELLTLALLFAVTSAVVVGLLAARTPNGTTDRLAALVSMVCLSVPSYVLAPLSVAAFAVHAQLFPSIGYVRLTESLAGNVMSLTLPALALGLPLFGLYARFLRGDLLEQIGQRGYVVTATAKGLGPWTVLIRHVFRNSLSGLASVVGLNLGALVGGAVIIEQIFALPGIGQLLLSAINTRDLPVVQGIVLITASITILANLCVDLLHMLLDPRIRHARA